MRRRLLLVLGVVLAAGIGLVSPGAAAPSGDGSSPRSPGASADSPGTSAPGDAGARRLALLTSDSQFDSGVDNQGWWSNFGGGGDGNTNYIVGVLGGTTRYRNFFTFDLSRIDQRVVGATLVLPRYAGEGNFTERLELSDVRTGAAALNNNRGRNESIYRDLGSGDRYGSFVLRTRGDYRGTVRLRLNGSAIRDLNAARGGFFSIGGNLLSTRGSGLDEQALFEESTSRGVQELTLFFE